MNSYIALFRGINVGGKNTLPMKALVEMLETMGYRNIKTYIQSGNAVFKSTKKQKQKIAREISLSVLDRYGFQPSVMLLDATEFRMAIKDNPFVTRDGKSLHFYFLESVPKQPSLERLKSVQSLTEKFELKNAVLYLYAPDGIGRSKLAANVERALGVSVTARNWNTVNKLNAMINDNSD
jgi:uncharacterized protein (DUF1697 family)